MKKIGALHRIRFTCPDAQGVELEVVIQAVFSIVVDPESSSSS